MLDNLRERVLTPDIYDLTLNRLYRDGHAHHGAVGASRADRLSVADDDVRALRLGASDVIGLLHQSTKLVPPL